MELVEGIDNSSHEGAYDGCLEQVFLKMLQGFPDENGESMSKPLYLGSYLLIVSGSGICVFYNVWL